MATAITKFMAEIEGSPVFDTEAEAKAAETEARVKEDINTFIEAQGVNKRRATEYRRIITAWEQAK